MVRRIGRLAVLVRRKAQSVRSNDVDVATSELILHVHGAQHAEARGRPDAAARANLVAGEVIDHGKRRRQGRAVEGLGCGDEDSPKLGAVDHHGAELVLNDQAAKGDCRAAQHRIGGQVCVMERRGGVLAVLAGRRTDAIGNLEADGATAEAVGDGDVGNARPQPGLQLEALEVVETLFRRRAGLRVRARR
jgi:hypothetical protein